MSKHVLAVDVGGSKISFLGREVSSERIVYRGKIRTPVEEGVEALLSRVGEHVDELPGGRSGLAALGLSMPGPVDTHGTVLRAGNLDGWVDVPLRRLLEQRYHLPVFVERDSNCGALGEKWRGAAADLESFVFLALGTGAGAGLFLDGRLYRGAHFASGEVGDLTFFPGQKWRSLSEVVGKQALKKAVTRATGKKLSAAEALGRAGSSRRLERATRPFVEQLAATVIAITSLLDPQAIVFGGGTSRAGDALLSRVEREVRKRLRKYPRLMEAALGRDAQLHGALWGALSMLRKAARPGPGADVAVLDRDQARDVRTPWRRTKVTLPSRSSQADSTASRRSIP